MCLTVIKKTNYYIAISAPIVFGLAAISATFYYELIV